ARVGGRIGPCDRKRRRDVRGAEELGPSRYSVREPGRIAGVCAGARLAQAASEVGGKPEDPFCDRFGAGRINTAASAHMPSASPAIVHRVAFLPRRLAITAVKGASARSTTIEVPRIVAGGRR